MRNSGGFSPLNYLFPIPVSGTEKLRDYFILAKITNLMMNSVPQITYLIISEAFAVNSRSKSSIFRLHSSLSVGFSVFYRCILAI